MIHTSGLAKVYGRTEALKGVDLSVEEASTYGLVGPNGAGKTTLLGILAGLRRPTAGSISIEADRSRIAVLPDTPRFDPWLTGREVAELAQRLTTGDGDRVEQVLADAGLTDAMDRPVGGYSRGMLQRLGVACTIVGDPRSPASRARQRFCSPVTSSPTSRRCATRSGFSITATWCSRARWRHSWSAEPSLGTE